MIEFLQSASPVGETKKVWISFAWLPTGSYTIMPLMDFKPLKEVTFAGKETHKVESY